MEITGTARGEPFMVGCPGSFDAAHAWVYGAAEHDGTIYLSYSGHDQGHKVGNRAAAIAMMPSKDLSFDHTTGPGCLTDSPLLTLTDYVPAQFSTLVKRAALHSRRLG